METQFNNYLHQYKLTETLEQKQALAAQFTAYYDSLSADDKQIMNKAMHPSLLELRAWTEHELDPLLTRAEVLLGRKVAI